MGPSDVKRSLDTHTCPVGGWVVLTSLKGPQLELDTENSKFLENNSGKHCLGRRRLGELASLL